METNVDGKRSIPAAILVAEPVVPATRDEPRRAARRREAGLIEQHRRVHRRCTSARWAKSHAQHMQDKNAEQK
jgi:hypothetical protein